MMIMMFCGAIVHMVSLFIAKLAGAKQVSFAKQPIFPYKRGYRGLHSPVGSASDRRSRDDKFKYLLGHVTFMEIGHKIITTVILSFPTDSKRAVVKVLA